jgi:hypothetical protein
MMPFSDIARIAFQMPNIALIITFSRIAITPLPAISQIRQPPGQLAFTWLVEVFSAATPARRRRDYIERQDSQY